MTGYKSLQVAEALSRVSQQLQPQVTRGSLENSVYSQNTNTLSPLGETNRQIEQANQYYNTLYSKTGSDYVQDAAVALGKGVVSVPQAVAGLADLGDAALSAVGTTLTGGNPADIQTGRVTKALDDAGLRFKETQDIMNGWYSEGTQKQLQELSALPGMSTEQSFGENMSSLGQTAAHVLDNPSIALNTIIQSLPAMGAGGAIGRVAGAVAPRLAGAAGAIGEGTIMAGAAQSNMDTDEQGYTTAAQSLGALGIGVLGGAVGQVGSRIANRAGADDIDSLAAGVPTQMPKQGFTSLAVGTATEAAEEAAQSSLENVIANVASGKDAIEGLNQDLVLGTFAGAGMGAATNAGGSLKSAALDAVMSAAQKQAEKMKERITKEAPERTDTETNEFADPKSDKYNPTAAIIREAQAVTSESTDEEVAVAKQKVDKVMNDAESNLAELQEMKELLGKEQVILNNIQGAQAAVVNFAESEPERAASAQQVLDNILLPQLEKLNQVKEVTDLEKVDTAIESAQGLVNEAREMHTKYSGLMNQAAGTQEQDQAQTPDAKIFGAPTSFTIEEINTAIADPAVPEQSKQALRVLADAIVAQNAVKSIDEVNGQIVGKKFDPQYRSTPQYMEQFSKAIKEKSLPAQKNLMREIQAFEQSHVQKAELVSTGLEQAKTTGQSVQIIRNNGQWEVNTDDFLKGDAAKKNGAVTIHATPRGIAAMEKTNEYMQAEAQAIVSTRAAMQAMQQLNPTQQQPRQSAVIPQAVEAMDFTAEIDPFQAVLDGYNQDMRSANEWQPNARSVDPRSTGVLEETVNPTAGETVIPTEAQPTSGSAPTTSQPTGTPTATQDLDDLKPDLSNTEIQFDETGVGSVVPTVDNPELVTEDNVQPITTDNLSESTENSLIVETGAEEQTSDTTEALVNDPNLEARKAERAKEPVKRNLVLDGFNRKPTTLNNVPNFVSTRLNREDNSEVIKELTGLDKVTPKQKKVVSDFSKFAQKSNKQLANIVAPKTGKTAKGNLLSDYNYQDFNQFLLEDGVLPENVTTAVSAASFSWIAENGSKTLDNMEDVVKKMLLEDVEAVPSHVYERLYNIGTHQNTVAAQLGQRAYQALGLSSVSDVDLFRKSKLEQALGTMAVVHLVQQGYLTRTTLTNEEMNKLIKDTMAINEDASEQDMKHLLEGHQFSFLNPATDVNGEILPKVKAFVESAKETSGVLTKLFDMPTDAKLPSTTPSTNVPDTFNSMGSVTPEYAKDVYEKSQKNGYSMSAPAMTFIDKVDNEDLKELFGYVKPNEDGQSFPGMHKKFWAGQLAANQALERSLDIIQDQRANIGKDDQEFFFEHTIWTNQRSGYDSVFNLQANKVHRAVAGMTAHKTEVSVGEATHDKNGLTTTYGEFLMAVAMTAEEIPIGLPTVDKITSKTYLDAFQEYLNKEHVQAGIVSMAAILEGNKVHKEDMDNVKALVKEFGMGPMSVRGIQALAQKHIAERDGSSTFTSDIGFESDGVTNGPIITNVALSTAYAEMLEAGGIFTDKNMTSVPAYKEGGGQDVYEQLGEVMKQKWTEYKNSPDTKPSAKASAQALDVIYNAFGERKGAKPITTTSNYGAGNASIIRANGREVLNAFYKGLEKAGKKGDMNAARDLVDAVNSVFTYHNFFKDKVPLARFGNNPLEFMLTPQQEQALLEISSIQHGKAIKNTLEEAMGNFQVIRDIITEHAVTGFAAYEIIRKDALDKALAENMDGVIVDGKGQRQEGLTKQQETKVLKSIARYTPSVISAMGNNSSNGKQSSIPLMKSKVSWDTTTMGSQQFNFTGSFEKGGFNQGKFTVRSGVRKNDVTDPGVSGLALIIQSIDSFIAHTVLGKLPTQNYHDANASKVGEGKKMAKIQNEAFVDGLMTTHVNREFIRAVLKPFQAFKDNPELYKTYKAEADAAYEKLTQSLVERVNFAYSRDLEKLNGMKKWENINQYGTEGGHFEMNNAKRKEIVNQVEQLRKDWKKDLAQAEAIQSLFKPKETKAETVTSMLNKGTVKGSDLVPLLQAEIMSFQNKGGNAGKFSQFYDSMLDLITDRMPAGLEINYFEKGLAPENVSGEQQALAKGNPAWFTTGKDGKPQINVIKTDKPILAQMLVHELIHAITVDSIDQVNNDPTAHPKAKESLDKLNALYDGVKARVAADPKASDVVKYGVQNLEEFIATGFTYPEFVDYLDNTLAPKAARGKNRIVTALRSFVENIFGVLEEFTGRKYSAKDATAFEALILDTTEFLGRVTPPVAGTQKSIFGAPQQARDKVASFTTKEVFDSLDSKLDQGFKDHLASMMTQVSDTIYAGLDSNMLNNPDGSWSMEKAWQEYINEGKALTTETATTAGFRMTEQETFAVESLYSALVAGIKDKSMTQVYKEMDKAFKSARDKLKPSDFSTDKQDGQDMYDFIFKLGSSNPEHLARFVAMAIGSQQFNSLLGFTAKDSTAPSGTSFEKLVEVTNDTLDYVTGLMTNSSSSQRVSSKVGLLAKELARIDAKNRAFAVSKVEKQVEKVADFTDGISNKVREKVAEFAEKDSIAKSRFTSVRFASHVTRLSAKGDLWTTLDVIKDGVTFDKPNEKLGFLGELVNEAANNDSTKSFFEKLLRLTKLNNQMKENLRDTTTKNVMSTFEENGSYLTKEDKQSFTLMLRSDVQVLDGTYSTADIAKLYSDKSFLNAERSGLEAQLLALDPKSQVMINRAKQLAKYMVTGLSSSGMAKNAQLIVSGFNSGEVVDITDPRVDLVDKLATMYAITYTSPADKARLNNVMKRELKNKVNGVDTSIKFHKELAKTARDTLFTSNPTSVIKGYVPEITNPNREIRIAHNQQEEQLYKNQFYKEVKTLQKDKRDPNNSPKLFLTEEANIQRLVSGAVEVVSTNRKGTQVILDHKSQARITADIARSIPTSPSYDPMNDKEVHMTPNYDTQGHVIGYSYEMSAANRDSLLERNNDFSELLGAYAATNFNKVTVPAQNKIVIDAAYQDYKDNFSSNPRAYVNVGPNSPDQGLREIWAMLPEDTRKHIDKVWGKDGMQIRNDVLLMTFGYRKYSLNQSFDKMDEAKGMFEKLYTGIMKEVFGNNAKIRGVQGERAWQEAVLLMKDIIVIRNVKTMLFNTMSNGMLLMAHGVSPTDIVKNSLLSVRAGLQYRKDTAELMAIRQKQRAGIGDFNKLEQQALKIEDSLSRNPLADFIEEGMMPTIVEDVDPDTNHYSYKNKLQQRMEGLTSGVPKSVKTAAKWAFVSPDTPLYKFLNNATQFSDFSAKYTMYQYYTQKAKDKLSHDEALQIASDNFINYDVPTSRGLQYMNDMGAVMFTKYNIRIQKALFQLLKKRPATAMAQALFINSFTNLEAGIDPLVWFNLGIPFREGAFGLPGALDEPLPVKIMSGMF